MIITLVRKKRDRFLNGGMMNRTFFLLSIEIQLNRGVVRPAIQNDHHFLPVIRIELPFEHSEN